MKTINPDVTQRRKAEEVKEVETESILARIWNGIVATYYTIRAIVIGVINLVCAVVKAFKTAWRLRRFILEAALIAAIVVPPGMEITASLYEFPRISWAHEGTRHEPAEVIKEGELERIEAEAEAEARAQHEAAIQKTKTELTEEKVNALMEARKEAANRKALSLA
jgi:hypothetical protein